MTPLRLSICTYNLWNTQRWPEREPALRQFLRCFGPDILATQELRAETRDCIDAELHTHARVEDAFEGWTCESNLWWRRDLFAYRAHGAEPYGSHEATRRLFWVRLARADGGGTILVATAHLTHTSHPEEMETGYSPRIGQTRAILDALGRLAEPGEPVWFTGDVNDPFHPSHMLHEAGYRSCFATLGLQPPPTFPAIPTAWKTAGEHQFNACFDWIMARGHVRPVAAHSPHCYYGDLSPSDHWPILAVYDIG